MKKRWQTHILIAVLIIGLSLVLYPTVSDWWNSYRQSRSVANHAARVAELDNDTYDKILRDAAEYNQTLLKNDFDTELTDSHAAYYNRTLNIDGDGVMAIVEIPKIDVCLPVYHGTDDAKLQVAVGHLEWSSLPIGGKNTHSVLSGHRGLPSARLFTDLDELENGDIFTVQVLDEVLTYEVDQIRIVLPDKLEELSIIEDEDLCTLVTCTPYGINSHRLLVRGHRIENINEVTLRVTADALHIRPIIVAPFVAMPILVALFVVLIIKSKKNRSEQDEETNS